MFRHLSSIKPRLLFVTAFTAFAGVALLLAQDAPGKPTGLSAEVVGNGVRLSWTAPSGQVDGYEILRRRPKRGEELQTLVANTGSSATSYTDTSATVAGERYFYRVKAIRNGVRGDRSGFAKADRPEPTNTPVPPPTNTPVPPPTNTAVPRPTNTPLPPPTNIPLRKPTNLTASVNGYGVALSWTAPSGQVDGYEILRRRPKRGEELQTLVANTGSSATSYTDLSATAAGERYFYRVRAIRNGVRSDTSNFAKADRPELTNTPVPASNTPVPSATNTPLPPGAPTNLTADVYQYGVTLSWTAPSGQVDGYEILRRRPLRGEDELQTLVANTGVSVTSFSDPTAAEAGERYIYRVKAIRNGVRGDWSNSARVDRLAPTATTEANAQRRAVINNQQKLTPSATNTLGFARAHGGTETHTPTPTATLTAAQRDRAALEALYDAAGGDNWDDNSNWKSAQALSTWHGVTVSGGRVTELALVLNNLVGTIPTQLGSLSSLTSLDLGSNDLTGTIPTQLGNLSNLQTLNLSGNGLSGSIPTQLGNLASLEDLDLGRNSLSGSIPTQLGNLSSLETLQLDENDLTGPIPSALGSLSNLTAMVLHANELSGSIPTQLGNLSSLVSLSLRNNDLTGAIPAELGNLSSLVSLTLRNNGLTGAIPSQLGSLSELTSLNLSANDLTGSIPTELGDLSDLVSLSLSDNSLTGAIPSELENLSNLLVLHLSGNSFSGCVPVGLYDVPTNDLADLSISACVTPTATATATATPGPTATGTLFPTATEDTRPQIGAPSLRAGDRSIYVEFGARSHGTSQVKVFWRRQGSGSYQSSPLVPASYDAGSLGILRGRYIIENLSGNTTYEVYLQGFNNAGVGGPASETRTATTYNLPIRNLRATGTAASFTVSWTQHADHAYYHIFWTKERGGTRVGEGGFTQNSYTLTGLEPGEPYIIEVFASDASDRHGQPEFITATPPSAGTSPPAPGRPTVAQVDTRQRVTITWNKPNVGNTAVIEKYEVRRTYQEAGSDVSLFNDFDPPVDADDVQLAQIEKNINVEAYTTYRFAVRVRTDIGGWSAWSSERSLTLVDPVTATPVPVGGPPARPAAPQITVVNDGFAQDELPVVEVSWNTPSTHATNLVLWFELDSDAVDYDSDYDSPSPDVIVRLEPSSSDPQTIEWTMLSRAVGKTHRFRVRAENASGFSAWSPYTSVMIPIPPQVRPDPPIITRAEVGVRSDGKPTITIHWVPPAEVGTSPIVKYSIFSRALGLFGHDVGATVRSYTLGEAGSGITLERDTIYRLRLSASNGSGESFDSHVSARTWDEPEKVTGLKVRGAGGEWLAACHLGQARYERWPLRAIRCRLQSGGRCSLDPDH